MQFAKANQECQSFLNLFIAGLFLKMDCKPFWRYLLLFFKYKSSGKQALPLKKTGAKRNISGMDSELKRSLSFLK
jgi:hypothetical protein